MRKPIVAPIAESLGCWLWRNHIRTLRLFFEDLIHWQWPEAPPVLLRKLEKIAHEIGTKRLAEIGFKDSGVFRDEKLKILKAYP